MNSIMFTVICSSLGTLLVVSVVRDIKHILNKNKNIKKHSYEVGERVIYKQTNYKNRLVGCEVLELKRAKKTNEPAYKVKAYTEDVTIWFLYESDIISTEKEFGNFPTYNNNCRRKQNE